jgi:drug/metabolite transporter (DMT)-like permease
MQASSASLLLSFEGVMTGLIAAIVFRESVSGRVWIGFTVMVAAGLLLAHRPHGPWALSIHAVAIVGACLMWAVDNNLTRKISTADPWAITTVKGVVAGIANLALARVVGEPTPGTFDVSAAMALGAISYGASLVLFILALRHLGAARATAHFGTAPFFGAVLAVALLGEPVTVPFVVALLLMASATVLVLSERHEHAHRHQHLVHSHVHSHDEHHTHSHAGGEGPEPHAHEHVHEPQSHSHPHLPDAHHRHGH